MPNGGSDCCGTCWFNRRNRGEKGYNRADDIDVEALCEIRDVLIENPFWTYCANHPHRRPQRDPISYRTDNAPFRRWIEQRSRSVAGFS